MTLHLMKRQTHKRKINKPAGSHVHPTNHCRAIVPVDGTAIRKKIRNDYEKALRDLETSRRQLDQFHQADLPQFIRWLNSNFGALLTELRETSQKLEAEEFLVLQVQSEMIFGAKSHAHAYQRVMEERQNPEVQPTAGGSPKEGQGPFGAKEHGDGDEDGEDPAEAFFDEMFGGFGPDDRARDKHQRHGAHLPKTSAPAHSRVKELYRALVRRLHPDTQGKMTAKVSEWWHQAQDAYKAGDAEQLEVILTLCEIEESRTTANTSASLLQRITARLKTSLRQINRELAQKRREPAWAFSRRTNHDVLALQLRRTLMAELQELRQEWQETQQMIAGWRAAAERLRPSRRRKKRRPQTWDCPF